MPTQAQKDFLRAVLTRHGQWYSLTVAKDGPPEQRLFARGSDLDAICARARAAHADVYIALGGFVPVAGASIHRRAENAAWQRCLRLDVDCGARKPYADKRAGWSATTAFLGASGLPAPNVIVDSGNGLHLYWTFTSDLPLAEWLPLAGQLASACARHGLAVDTRITQDAARVLRLPDTTNWKHVPRAVRLGHCGAAFAPDVLREALAPYPVMPQRMLPPAADPGVAAINSALGAGTSDYPPYGLRGIFASTGCPGLHKMLVTHGAGVSEPLWKSALDIIAASSNTEAEKDRVARAISDGYAGFDEQEFERKWERAKRDKYQPATCETLVALGLADCADCAAKFQIRSPVVLGRTDFIQLPPTLAPSPAPPSTATTPTIRGALQQGGLVFTPGSAEVRIVDGRIGRCDVKNGIFGHFVAKTPKAPLTWEPLCNYQITRVSMALDAAGTAAYSAVSFVRGKDGEQALNFDGAALADARTFNHTLTSGGVFLTPSQAKNLKDIVMVDLLTAIQQLRQSAELTTGCGWTADNRRFVLGTRSFDAYGGVRPITVSDQNSVLRWFAPAGDEALWRSAFELAMGSGSGERQAVLALAIAAPLMKFTGVDGAMLNVYSHASGVGKSTLAEAALSLWGAPDRIRGDAKDTPAVTFHLLGQTGNLPYVVDEFTNCEGLRLSDFIYTMTQGREKNRLTREAQMRKNNNRWCCPVITTSNNSVVSKLQAFRGDAVAEIARVLEIEMPALELSVSEVSNAKERLVALRTNYGFFGQRLAQWYAVAGESRLRKAITERIRKWDSELGCSSEDRFKVVLVALIDFGAGLGKKLGLPFDTELVRAALHRCWDLQARSVQRELMATDEVFSAFYTKYGSFMGLVIDHGKEGERVAEKAKDFMAGELVVRENGTVLCMRVPSSTFNAFCSERRFDSTQCLRLLTNRTGVSYEGTKQRRRFMSFAGHMRLRALEVPASMLGELSAVGLPPEPEHSTPEKQRA